MELASRPTRLRQTRCQWRLLWHVAIPFAAASLCIYLAAARDILLHPHGPEVFTRTIVDIGVKLFFGVALWLAPLAISGIRPKTYLFVAAPFVCLLFIPNMLYALEYRELVSIGAIEAAMSTNTQETLEFLSERMRGVVLTSGLLGLTTFLFANAVRLVARDGNGLIPRARIMVGITAAVVLCVGMAFKPRLFPVTFLKNAVEYYDYVGRLDDLAQDGRSLGFGAAFAGDEEVKETYVIILGESMRRSQLSHYGYGRPTSPRLDTLTGVVFLEDVISSAGTTQTAVKSALTPATSSDVHRVRVPSVLHLARELGFTTTWISNQDRIVDTELAGIAGEADEMIFTNHDWEAFGSLDENVIDPLQRALVKPERKKLVVVHLMGSHGEYRRRYPGTFRPLSWETCASIPFGCARGWSREQLALVNEYDTSIAYTDSVVAEVIKQVGREKGITAVLFFADHGEELFDTPHGRQGHGFPIPTRYEVEIPALVWLSPEFGRRRPHLESAVRSNRYREMGSEDMFYAIADLMSAAFPTMDATRSFFSAQYAEKPRLLATPDRSLMEYACLKMPSRVCPKLRNDSPGTSDT